MTACSLQGGSICLQLVLCVFYPQATQLVEFVGRGTEKSPQKPLPHSVQVGQVLGVKRIHLKDQIKTRLKARAGSGHTGRGMLPPLNGWEHTACHMACAQQDCSHYSLAHMSAHATHISSLLVLESFVLFCFVLEVFKWLHGKRVNPAINF